MYPNGFGSFGGFAPEGVYNPETGTFEGVNIPDGTDPMGSFDAPPDVYPNPEDTGYGASQDVYGAPDKPSSLFAPDFGGLAEGIIESMPHVTSAQHEFAAQYQQQLAPHESLMVEEQGENEYGGLKDWRLFGGEGTEGGIARRTGRETYEEVLARGGTKEEARAAKKDAKSMMHAYYEEPEAPTKKKEKKKTSSSSAKTSGSSKAESDKVVPTSRMIEDDGGWRYTQHWDNSVTLEAKPKESKLQIGKTYPNTDKLSKAVADRHGTFADYLDDWEAKQEEEGGFLSRIFGGSSSEDSGSGSSGKSSGKGAALAAILPALSSALPAVLALFGKKTAADDADLLSEPTGNTTYQKPDETDPTMMAMMALGGIALVGVGIWAVTRKKDAPASSADDK